MISGIILISPCLSIAYVVLDKDEQFYEAVLDENTSLEFRQKYITFFTSLYNADKSGILITNDWPLINRFSMFDISYTPSPYANSNRALFILLF